MTYAVFARSAAFRLFCVSSGFGRSGLFPEANLFDQRASNVPDRDVSFLDALRVAGRHVQQQIDFIGERTACFAGQRHAEGAAARSGLDAAHDVWTRTASGDGHEDVPAFYERFNLPRKDLVEAKIVSSSGQDGSVCRQRQGWKSRAVGMEAHHEFSGQMLRVGRAPAVAEKDEFASRSECFGGTQSESLNANEQLIGETLLYAATFAELRADLFHMRAHDDLHEDDFTAVAGDAPCRVS